MLILVCSANPLFSQQLSPTVIATSGGFYSNASGMLSFTTGEMSAVETYSKPNSILTQGFQQPWDLGTYITEHPFEDFSYGIYPNPSDGQFYVLTKSSLSLQLTISISDLLGKQIEKKHLDALNEVNIESVDLTQLAAGTYLVSLLVSENNTNRENIFNTKITIVK